MSFLRSLVAIVFAAVVAAVWVLYASAQQPAPHHGAAAGMHAGATMPATMMASQRMIHDADQMMTHAAAMLHDMPALHAGQHGQHHEAMTSMQTMLDHMRQVHGHLDRMSHDPALVHDRDAMKSFHQACQDLKRMAASFDSMTRNMSRAMKGTADAGGK